ncbi:MAG: glycosyltransferase [Parvularculaceae bacterium]|nr:glycosyltransferase [Parvularculaceae bacterium]
MSALRLAVVIATLGRPTVVAALLSRLEQQTRRPDRVVVVVVSKDDAPAQLPVAYPCAVLTSPTKGSCAQRNFGIDALAGSADVVLFLDDDFVPAHDFGARLVDLFERRPDVVGATGRVLIDGATGPGFGFDEAVRVVDAAQAANYAVGAVRSLYGCNMAFRMSAVGDARFDERLPLYGWLEDVDFSRRIGVKGLLVRDESLRGAHLGAKGGRTSGVRFGYSQVANPVYLLQQRTISLPQALNNLARTLLANHVKVVAPEPWIDRKGRVRGNWMAIADIVRGKARPERILEIE